MVKNCRFYPNSNMKSSFPVRNIRAQSAPRSYGQVTSSLKNQDCYNHISCTCSPSQRLRLQMLQLIRWRFGSSFNSVCGLTKTIRFPLNLHFLNLFTILSTLICQQNYPGISTRTQSIVGRGSHPSGARARIGIIKTNKNLTFCPFLPEKKNTIS